jgi:hypothetical protein
MSIGKWVAAITEVRNENAAQGQAEIEWVRGTRFNRAHCQLSRIAPAPALREWISSDFRIPT